MKGGASHVCNFYQTVRCRELQIKCFLHFFSFETVIPSELFGLWHLVRFQTMSHWKLLHALLCFSLHQAARNHSLQELNVNLYQKHTQLRHPIIRFYKSKHQAQPAALCTLLTTQSNNRLGDIVLLFFPVNYQSHLDCYLTATLTET